MPKKKKRRVPHGPKLYKCPDCGAKTVSMGAHKRWTCPRRKRVKLAVRGLPARPVEAVNHPSHYGGDTPHEVYKCLEAWGLTETAYLWNAVKYIARAGRKPGAEALEDLKKARWYLERAISEK